MKQLAAILLLGILLFNWVGYEFYTAIEQQRADRSLRADLDENRYSPSDLLAFKFPATNLGYYSNDAQYARVDGKVVINGVQYSYVKRRIFNDSLELLCIPNQTASRLQTARDEFFKLVNDLQHPGHSKKADGHSASFKGFTGEYYESRQPGFDALFSGQLSAQACDRYLFAIPDISVSPAGQPPDRA